MRNHTWLVMLLLVLVLIAVLWRMSDRGIVERWDTRQLAQSHSMEAALELFSHETGDYPPSDANDPTGVPYCGATKLAEAVMGKDLLGFHARSVFRADGLDPNGGIALYPEKPNANNLEARKGPYLQANNANADRLADVYGEGNTRPFPEDALVLCDSFEKLLPSGKRIGMPILYYRAHPEGTAHDVKNPDNPANIYDYRDNQMLVGLGVPGEPNAVHPLSDPVRFYLNTQSIKPLAQNRPAKEDTFILISAGSDGLYGTSDDVCYFSRTYRE